MELGIAHGSIVLSPWGWCVCVDPCIFPHTAEEDYEFDEVDCPLIALCLIGWFAIAMNGDIHALGKKDTMHQVITMLAT